MVTTILLVEDEPSIAQTITFAMEREGFACLWCSTGTEGLDRIETQVVDLLILDVGLPDCNGFDLCRQIRKKHDFPIVFLTARHEEIDRIVGLEIGADDYVVKPFSPRELAARVKAILRRVQRLAESEEPSRPKDHTFALDEARCRICFCGQDLQLSRYEYLILRELILRPGRVFSRDLLMERVWDEPGSAMERTVDTHIKSIRAKLRQIDPDRDVIVTHRGLGYSLKESP